jgi:hypothetical protein
MRYQPASFFMKLMFFLFFVRSRELYGAGSVLLFCSRFSQPPPFIIPSTPFEEYQDRSQPKSLENREIPTPSENI